MESLLTDPKFAPEVVKLLEAKLLTLTSELEDVKKENFELRSAADSTSHLPGLEKEEVFIPPVYTIFEDLDKLCATVAATPSADFQTGIGTIRDEYHRCASALEELRKTHWDAEKRLAEVRKKLEEYVPFDDEVHTELMSDSGHGDAHGVDYGCSATAPSTIYPACISILENLPCAESIPIRSELQALFEKGIRMNDHCMPRVLKTTCKGEGPLSLRSRVYWPSELGQHAILVSPAERYQQDEKWEPYNELQAYAGRTYELFYNDDDADGKISYAGTYKCLSISTLPSECYEKLPDSTCRELFRIARQRHNIPFNWRKRFNNDFVFGERQISFLPLQCIGFNHVLYDKIIAKNQKNSLKRKGVSSDSGTLSDGGEVNKKARDAIGIDELI